MDSVAPRVTRARSTGPDLSGPVIWRSLTAALVAGAAVVVWALPHEHRAVEPLAGLPVSGGETLSASSTAERMTAIGEAVHRGDLATARAAWDDAYRSLRRTRDWQGMAELGDTALEIAGEHLLPRTGFTEVDMFGDFDRSPVRRDSPAFLVVAR